MKQIMRSGLAGCATENVFWQVAKIWERLVHDLLAKVCKYVATSS